MIPNSLQKYMESLSMSQVVRLMIQSIEESGEGKSPIILNFNTYGYSRENLMGNIICYGCAATNLAYKLMAENNSGDLPMFMENLSFPTNQLSSLFGFAFERAINGLRLGELYTYHIHMLPYPLVPNIPKEMMLKMRGKLPELHNLTWKENIQKYGDFADLLEQSEKS